MQSKSDDSDDADCNDMATVSQGGIEPRQNCFVIGDSSPCQYL